MIVTAPSFQECNTINSNFVKFTTKKAVSIQECNKINTAILSSLIIILHDQWIMHTIYKCNAITHYKSTKTTSCTIFTHIHTNYLHNINFTKQYLCKYKKSRQLKCIQNYTTRFPSIVFRCYNYCTMKTLRYPVNIFYKI